MKGKSDDKVQEILQEIDERFCFNDIESERNQSSPRSLWGRGEQPDHSDSDIYSLDFC